MRRSLSPGTGWKIGGDCADELTHGAARWTRTFSATSWSKRMSDDLQQKIESAIGEPKNLGEMPNADAVGTAGSADCGDMLRMWIKFREEGGKKVIDKATFQTFGCETAIAVASLATQLIQGKTPEEAMAMDTEALSAPLG